MKHAARTAIFATAFSVALAFAGASTARGQVFFQGNFPVPHGRVSVGVGVPSFEVGGYVPAPYADSVYYRPSYGYGFSCDAGWVPVRRYRDRWIISQRPVVGSYGYRSYRRDGHFDRFDRDGRRFERRFDRDESRFHSRRDWDRR